MEDTKTAAPAPKISTLKTNQQYRKTEERHHDTYKEALEDSKQQVLKNTQRMRIRARGKGFDVIIYTKLPEGK